MKAIAYIRVSTVEQACEGVSIDAQRAKIEAYAAFRGLDLVDVIIDAGVSASKPLSKRPGGARLLAAVASDAVDAVVSAKLDRLFRDASDCLGTTRAWDDAGVALHLLDLAIDTSTPMGRAFLTMAAAFAELERNLIAERTRDALAQVRREGVQLGAEALGWTRTAETDTDGRRIVRKVSAELDVIDRIVAMRRTGATYQAIADALDADDVATKRGGRWQPTTVRNAYLRAEAAGR